jgi:prefoldin alpha subunit
MASLEENRVRMNYEVAIYREQLAMLRREMERVSLTTMDLSSAAQAVNGLKAEQILVPIGGGVFVRGEVKDTRVIVPIGAEFAVDMEKGEAEVELQRRVEATRQAVTKLNEEFEKINKKLREVTFNLQDVDQQLRLSKQVEAGVKEDYI